MNSARSSDLHVAARDLSKRFGGVQALSDISVEIHRGRVHALVGENGAGKSTLAKIIAGVQRPSSGVVEVDGRAVAFAAPREALRAGIAMMQQEVSLVPELTAIENVFVGETGPLPLPRRQRARLERFAELARVTGTAVRADRRVGTLRIPQQQQVELMRALARDARLVVLDEPTASLSRPEALSLLETIRRMRDRGVTVIFVSHALDDVLAVADDITVMRNGAVVRTRAAADETRGTLIDAMLGGASAALFIDKEPVARSSPVVLRADKLVRGRDVREVSLHVRAGEIVGLAGIVGSGRTEVARSIAGIDRLESGLVLVDEQPICLRSPRDAKRAGIVLLPESRKDEGLLLNRSVRENLSLPYLATITRGGLIDRRREQELVEAAIEQFDIRPPSPGRDVAALSGGNQQKVLFAKWLTRTPRVFIADEPTRGVDVGAKAGIYALIRSLASEGLGVLVVSSEMEEIIGLAHRVLVMRAGAIVAEFAGEEIQERPILSAALGAADAERPAPA